MSTQTAGNVPANQVLPQIRSGIVSFSVKDSAKLIVFEKPMPDRDYAVLIEPATVLPTVTARTEIGFTLSFKGSGATFRWVAIHFI